MTVLSDALTAAQARAVAALAKRYVGGTLAEDETPEQVLRGIGLADPTDTAHLIAAWDFLRDSGVDAPAEQAPRAEAPPEPASDAQWSFIRDLCKQKSCPLPDEPLTKVQASDAISELQAGTYDPVKWRVPF
jgi:hypothetical protein